MSTPAGWYPQPDGTQRWWDGTNWTEHTASGPEVTPEVEASPADDEPAVTERADIVAAKAAMSTKFGGGREIKRLEEHLQADETVARMIVGRYSGKNGLLTLTDRRAIFIADGRLSKATEDLPLTRITSVSWKSGVLLGTIEVHASGAQVDIENVNKVDGKAMVEALRTATHEAAHPAPAPAQQAAPVADDPVALLARLGQLRDAGVLTPEEFEAKKAEILSRI